MIMGGVGVGFVMLSRGGGGGEGGFAGLNDLTGYAGGNFMFLVGPPKLDRP